MRITCPQCGFFRDIPDNKVPVTSTMATCPKCRHRFKFRLDREPAPRRPESRSQAPLPGVEEAESSWRRPGPAAARREATPAPASRFDPDTLPPLPEEDVHEIPAPSKRRSAPPEPLEPAGPLEEEAPAHFREPAPENAPGVADDAEEPYAVAPPRRRRLSDAADDAQRPTPPQHAPRHERPPSDETPPYRADEPRQPPAPAAPPSEETPAAPAARHDVPNVPDATPGAHDVPEEPRTLPAPEPKAEEPAPRRSDGVRDIWARLKAMDEGPSKKPVEPESLGDPFREEETPPREIVSDPIPWERLDAYGFFPGLFLTLKKLLFTPMTFFGEMPEGRPKSKALVFNLLISEFLLLLDFLWSLFGLRAKLGGSAQSDALGAAAATPGLGFLIALLLVPLAIALGIYLDAWLTHLLLLLFRSAKKGFNETFRVMCYSAAPTVLSAIPVAGQILSPVILVWYMALQAIGLKKVHEGAYTQTLAAIFIKWSLYLFLLLAMLQNFTPGQ